jgi:zinc transport system ATP-binding protein
LSNNIIEISNLEFCYTPGDPVLTGVNLTLKEGESGCIVGPNGGGKSTLLKLILGQLQPTSGKILLFGASPKESRLKVGYMPQYHLLDPSFPVTVSEVVLMGRMRGGKKLYFNKKDRLIAQNALEELNIADLANKSFAALSGGQRQRVLIARAIVCEPQLLLLDEPTANIDPGAGEKFYATLDVLRKRMTVLTVSHDLGFVSREIDTVICVNRRLSRHQAADFTAETANEVYHHHVNLIRHDHSCFCQCEDVQEEAVCSCGKH